jgi:hypothetical protein
VAGARLPASGSEVAVWRSVRDPSTVDTFLEQNRGVGASEQLAELLRWLRSNAGERELYAVTSLGKLHFTTSSNYMERDGHPYVAVLREDGAYVISYFRPGESQAAVTTSLVDEGELIDTVQRFLLRLLKETD